MSLTMVGIVTQLLTFHWSLGSYGDRFYIILDGVVGVHVPNQERGTIEEIGEIKQLINKRKVQLKDLNDINDAKEEEVDRVVAVEENHDDVKGKEKLLKIV